jgi:hypothetical protein
MVPTSKKEVVYNEQENCSRLLQPGCSSLSLRTTENSRNAEDRGPADH